MDLVHDTRLYIQLCICLMTTAETSIKTNPEYTLATLCDISKAFAVISHKILLQKLINYGIRDIANKWFEIFCLIEPNMLNLAILSLS